MLSWPSWLDKICHSSGLLHHQSGFSFGETQIEKSTVRLVRFGNRVLL